MTAVNTTVLAETTIVLKPADAVPAAATAQAPVRPAVAPAPAILAINNSNY